jgi:hypothetical protein
MGRNSWSNQSSRQVKARIAKSADGGIHGPTHTYVTDEVGPVEVTFGRYTHDDRLFVTWRGEDLHAPYFWPDPEKRERAKSGRDGSSLLDEILTVEDEFQTRKRRDAIRKEAAKNPLPALLSRLEEVLVRGVDLRSGNALIIRADGSKENVRPAYLLADLDQHDRLDGARLYRAAIEAAKVATAAKAKSKDSKTAADEALAALGLPDGEDLPVVIDIDFETCERSTDFQGERIVRAEAREVEDAVRARLLAAEWPLTHDRNHFRESLVRILDVGVGEHDTLWRSAEDFGDWEAAASAAGAAIKTVADWEAEHLFDLSQFTGLNEEAERQARQQQDEQKETDEVAAAIAKSIRAPEGAGDWED